MHIKTPSIPELDYQLVMNALREYAYPRKALSDLLARGDLVRVKKGLYVQSGFGIPPYSKEVLSNMIYGPSYISSEYALAYYGLIPEHVVEVTSVTTRKSKVFTSPVGKFSFMHVPVPYYSFGFIRKEFTTDERAFLIADPAKALADRVLKENGRFSVRSMKTFLFDNLRIDIEAFRNLDKSIFAEAARVTGRQSLEILRKVGDGTL